MRFFYNLQRVAIKFSHPKHSENSHAKYNFKYFFIFFSSDGIQKNKNQKEICIFVAIPLVYLVHHTNSFIMMLLQTKKYIKKIHKKKRRRNE